MTQLLFSDIPVLLVEDSSFVRSMVRRMLRQVGLRNVTEVADGEGALDALQTFSPELLLLDWHLPNLNGGQILEIIRDPQISARTDLPVILFSGAPTKTVIERASKLGVTCFLKKPFAPSDLWKRMHSLGFGPADTSRIALQ